jgi:hypothetical protein
VKGEARKAASEGPRRPVKLTKAKPREDGSSPPVLIRKWSVTDAAAYEGRQFREGLLASRVWADTT